jgi:murein DD-endopeptidase MepM/ murein hydrolase activator NlpD
LAGLAATCSSSDGSKDRAVATSAKEATRSLSKNVFDNFMHTDYAPADGFDFPVGNPDGEGEYVDGETGKRHSGWHVSVKFVQQSEDGIHTGEDWNNHESKDTDRRQDVHAVAYGRVVFAGNRGKLWGNVIVIEHTFYENFERKMIYSVYANLLNINARVGETVKRHQTIAEAGQDPDKINDVHLHWEMRWDATLAPDYQPTGDE